LAITIDFQNVEPTRTEKNWNSWNEVRELPKQWDYECVTKSFRTKSITKYMLTIMNTRSEATQRVMATKLNRLTHKIAIQLHLVAESYTFAVVVPGGQSGNFWWHPRILNRAIIKEVNMLDTLSKMRHYQSGRHKLQVRGCKVSSSNARWNVMMSPCFS
jgi:hypothetical protein